MTPEVAIEAEGDAMQRRHPEGRLHIVSVSAHKQREGRDGANLLNWQSLASQSGGATCIWAGPVRESKDGSLTVARRPRSRGLGTVQWIAWAVREARSAVRQATGRGEEAVLNGGDPVGWIAAWLVARRHDQRWIMEVHGDLLQLPPRTFGRLKRGALAFLTSFFARRASLVRVVSEPIRDSLAEKGIASRLLPSRLLPLWETPTEREAQPFGSPVWRILAVGSLIPTKGFDLLIEAFASAASRPGGPGELVIVGSGPEREALEALARSYGVWDKVSFAGFLAPEAVRGELAHADLFVISSRSEGLPRVLLEAVASGVPVVTTGVGGIPHVAKDFPTMRVVDVSAASIAAGLLEMAADPPPGPALEAARSAVISEYGFESNLAAVCALYEEVVAGHG